MVEKGGWNHDKYHQHVPNESAEDLRLSVSVRSEHTEDNLLELQLPLLLRLSLWRRLPFPLLLLLLLLLLLFLLLLLLLVLVRWLAFSSEIHFLNQMELKFNLLQFIEINRNKNPSLVSSTQLKYFQQPCSTRGGAYGPPAIKLAGTKN